MSRVLLPGPAPSVRRRSSDFALALACFVGLQFAAAGSSASAGPWLLVAICAMGVGLSGLGRKGLLFGLVGFSSLAAVDAATGLLSTEAFASTGRWRADNEWAATVALLPALFLGAGGSLPRPLGLAGAACASYAVFATGSRGGAMLWLLSVGALACLQLARRKGLPPVRRVVGSRVVGSRVVRSRVVRSLVALLVGALVLSVVLGLPGLDGDQPLLSRLVGDPPRADGKALDGRTTIWRQALFLAADAPRTGHGVGRFGALVPSIYPWPMGPWPMSSSWPGQTVAGGAVSGPGDPSRNRVDDAHQLLLEAAVAGGWPAALGLLGLAGLLIRAAGQRSEPRSGEAWRAGVLASLGAHGAWSLVDTTAPGSPGFALSALLVGWAFHAHDGGPSVRGSLPPVGIAVTLWAMLFLVSGPERRRTAALHTASSAGPDVSRASVPEALRSSEHCADRRVLALLEQQATRRAIDCGPGRLPLLAAISPTDREAARQATLRWPGSASAWRWRAAADPTRRVQHLRRVVELAPRDGPSWLALGADLQTAGQASEALEAYAQACRYGDPGANACGRAARLAEAAGQIERAEALRRQSTWAPIRNRSYWKAP